MKNSIALFVVFYPGIELFIEDFFNSVINQSCKDFDLIIVNDGWRCKNLANQYPNLHIVELPGGNSIAKNREIGINYVIKQKYRYLLLCDADDTFHPQRVESSIRSLQKYDIVVNDVNIISVDGQVVVSDYFCKSLKGNEVLDMDFILKKNIFGFSNTAIKLEQNIECTFPQHLKVVDWYFFTQLLFVGRRACFIPVSLTNYRQHSNNLIGITSFTVEMFRRLTNLKIEHFESLSKWNAFFLPYAKEAKSLESLADEEVKVLLDKRQKENQYPQWWEFINY